MLLILPMASCVPARHSPSPTESAYDLPAFARALDSLRTAARIPGLSAAVVKDGEVIFAVQLRSSVFPRIPVAPPNTNRYPTATEARKSDDNDHQNGTRRHDAFHPHALRAFLHASRWPDRPANRC